MKQNKEMYQKYAHAYANSVWCENICWWESPQIRKIINVEGLPFEELDNA